MNDETLLNQLAVQQKGSRHKTLPEPIRIPEKEGAYRFATKRRVRHD